MIRASALLPKVMNFRNELVRYGNLLNKGQRQEAARVRTELNMQWGELETDLDRRGINQYYNRAGRSFPLFKMALRVPSEFTLEDVFEDIQMATSELETMLGKLQRAIQEGTPIRHSFWFSAFVFTFIAGWLTRHYQDQMILLSMTGATDQRDLPAGIVRARRGTDYCGQHPRSALRRK